MTIRVYGDSISLPRAGEGVNAECSWPEVVERELGPECHVINRSLGGATISELHALQMRDKLYFSGNGGVVILRLGIVDCTPRPVSPKTRERIGKLPEFIRKHIVAYLHENRKRIITEGYSLNSPPQLFNLLYDQMVKQAVADGVCICVGIGPVSDSMADRNPALRYEINSYNAAIREIVDRYDKAYYVDVAEEVNGADDGGLLADGHHNNRAAHEKIGVTLARIVKEYYSK